MGITAGENGAQRLSRDHGIWSAFSKKRGLNRRTGPPVPVVLVERDFIAAVPDRNGKGFVPGGEDVADG